MPRPAVYDVDYQRLPGADNWLVLIRRLDEPTAIPWAVVISRIGGKTYSRAAAERHRQWTKGRPMRPAPATLRNIHAAARWAIRPELED